MINPDLWYGFFVIILTGYFLILFTVKDKYRYVVYFISGFLLGFYFDFVSVLQNYYTYHYYFPSFLNVPITVTVAEGCSVAITIYLYNFIRNCFQSRSFGIKNLP